MRPTVVAIAAALLFTCGAPPVPAPADAGLPPYTGQEQCFCRDLGFTCEPATCTDRSNYGRTCTAFLGCGLDADPTLCRQVCAWN